MNVKIVLRQYYSTRAVQEELNPPRGCDFDSDGVASHVIEGLDRPRIEGDDFWVVVERHSDEGEESLFVVEVLGRLTK